MTLKILLLLSTILPIKNNGQYSFVSDEISNWINSLKDKRGVGCCSTADGYQPDEVDWDRTTDTYKVLIKGIWYAVPKEAKIDEPNKLGSALVWYWLQDNVPQIRCFIPGTEG